MVQLVNPVATAWAQQRPVPVLVAWAEPGLKAKAEAAVLLAQQWPQQLELEQGVEGADQHQQQPPQQLGPQAAQVQ
jgi:hypothetical protein